MAPRLSEQFEEGPSQVLATFLQTRSSRDVDCCYQALQALRPDRLEPVEILHLIEWVETNCLKSSDACQHVNIFGTGGDRTINISSMATILASKMTPVIKVGTRAVLSRFGSSQFNTALDQYLTQCGSPTERELLRFENGSRFLSLSSLGFPYNEILLKARRQLGHERIPDIYKVVFPFANYTSPVAQINGVSSEFYWEIYCKLAILTRRKVIIVMSAEGHDEIMPGRNRILPLGFGADVELELVLQNSHAAKNTERFSEHEVINHSIIEFVQECLGRGDRIIWETVKLNAGLVAAANEIATKGEGDLIEQAQSKSRDIQLLIDNINYAPTR